jgi:hypothetical protein
LALDFDGAAAIGAFYRVGIQSLHFSRAQGRTAAFAMGKASSRKLRRPGAEDYPSVSDGAPQFAHTIGGFFGRNLGRII